MAMQLKGGHTMSKKVLVPVADGSEEIEAVCIVDVLRRAGADVTVASVGGLQITASRGVKLVADRLIADCMDENWDLVVLPGGLPGADHLRDSAELAQILRRQADRGALYGAICAAPAVVLQTQGLLAGRRATAHPAFIEPLKDADETSRVVVDGNCVTSRGPGTAIEFALELVAQLFGPETARETAAPMVVPQTVLESFGQGKSS
jgi:4-methyl-5(b-hydroxyethyl)-thiazole monophosphate biosynthesis